MKTACSRIEKEIERILPLITTVRLELHRNPELALQEFATASYIRSQLASHAIQALEPLLETDVVALISGRGSGRNVALRADIDALPIQELSDCLYRSVVPSVMHACGHDGHSAMLLGAAIILEQLKMTFDGSVRLVFQPGEEVVAAGKQLVARGALEKPAPDAILALHAWGGHPLGVIASRAGAMMAAADFFRITITGKGGHGSRPERTVDPILAATRVISSLYEIPSRRIGALDPVVISVCSIHGGQSSNVIPDEVVLEGSIRYLSKAVGEKLPELVEHALQAACDPAGASYNLEYTRPYIPTVNDAAIVDVCREVTLKNFGPSAWVDLEQPTMGSEDFAYYVDRHPGAMFFIGMGENSPQLHNNRFDFNDRALARGILFLVLSTLELLRR